MMLKIYKVIFLIYLVGINFVFEAVGQMVRSKDVSKGGSVFETDTKEGGLVLPLLPLLEEEPEKTLKFYQEDYWPVKLEQVKSFDFLKTGGSDLFYYYVQIWFNALPSAIPPMKDSWQKQSWNKFCYESNCLNGLDPEKINGTDMPSVIRKLSDLPSINLSPPSSADQYTEATVFIQGSLAPRGHNLWLFMKNKKDSQANPEHLTQIDRQINAMRRQNIKRIAVNLPPQLHEDPMPFILLGQFIRQKEIDLYVVGGCGHYCALYLVPAAKTVYIEPYGYIYHKGSFTGLLNETLKGTNIQRRKYMSQLAENWVSHLTTEKTIDFVVDAIVSMAASSLDDLQRVIITFQSWLDKNISEQGKEFRAEFKRFNVKLGKISISDWTAEEVREFIQILSPELLKNTALFFRVIQDEQIQKSMEYGRELQDLSAVETAYYNVLKTSQRFVSHMRYEYMEFLLLSGQLLKDPRYIEISSEPKPYYNVPEKDKPYEWIVPSAELLRNMGLDVRGDNNKEMIDFTEFPLMSGGEERYSAEQFMYLDSITMESCGFFNRDAFYKTEELKECLSRE